MAAPDLHSLPDIVANQGVDSGLTTDFATAGGKRRKQL